MEHYLAHTDYPIWEVIQNGNGPVSITTDTQGQIKVLPPRTAEEIQARERERKARTTLLMALPKDHLAKFHKMTDAKEMWDAIKSRFGGNDESKKMQKYILKQQFEGFFVSNSEGLHKGYDRFQSLLSQLEIHGAGVSTEALQNQEFLRSLNFCLVSSFLIMRTNQEWTISAFCPITGSLRNLEQLDEYVLEENGLEMAGGYDFDENEKVLQKDCRRRDAWNSGNKDGRRSGKQEDFNALVTIDGEGVDWTNHSEEEDYALMACNNSGLNTEDITCLLDLDIEVDYSPILPMVQNKTQPRDCDFYEKRMAKQVVLNNRLKRNSNQREIRPIWNNMQRVNNQNQFVPTTVLTRTDKIPVNTARTSGTKNVSTANHSFNRQAVLTSTAIKVKTVKPIMNRLVLLGEKGKLLLSPQQVVIGDHKDTITGTKSPNTMDYPHRALQNKGIIDSGCSRHMTRNKAYFAEYQDFNGGPIAFGGSKGYITGKGKIKIGKLDFEDVCFVKELQHFNLFSVSQMCDKKNKVLFTDSECLVSKTKHIAIRHHFIRDAYEKKLIQVLKIHTDDNVADLLTKAFDVSRFQFLVVTIGMINP
ncbi:hypothetical protein Tco_0341413 [Tanacetum coccineum]